MPKQFSTDSGVGNRVGQSFRLSSINRRDKWTPKELSILAREDLTDYQKAKLLPKRKDGAVRLKRKRMGFKSTAVVFNRQFEHGGYTFIRKNGGYQRRFRSIIEEQIGRKLKSTEIVHHINGDKLDDRPENLYLCSSRAEHNFIHYQTMEIIHKLMEQNKVAFKDGRYILC